MSWLLLLGAIASDVLATFALEASEGFTRKVPATLAVVVFGATIYLYGLAITRMAAPLAYALFGAIGTAAVAAIGLALGTQPRNWISFAGLALIIIGVGVLPLGSR